MKKISKWCVRFGWIFIAYSGLAFMSNFLPVDFWITISNFFTGEDSHTYYKVVATEGGQNYVLATLILGAGLVVLGKVIAAKSKT
ncbi:hypothetical protein [Microbulbifer sp. JMSA008]|uniref:hypothetical protein n=1 Tax=Microbulbifer sp. JMSA008 TaxID=3243373 RepID=UPI00403905C9